MIRGTIRLFAGNLLGKMIGLIREILLAAFFGTGISVSAYRVAETAVLGTGNVLISEGYVSSFIPLYSNYLETDRYKAAVLQWVLLFFVSCIGVVLAVLAYLFSGKITGYLAPGFDPTQARLAQQMLVIMVAGLPLYLAGCHLAFIGAAHEHWGPSMTRSSAQSLGMITCTILAWFFGNIHVLALGFVVGYSLFAITCYFHLKKVGDLVGATTALSQWLKALPVLFAFAKRFFPLMSLSVMSLAVAAVERAIASLVDPRLVASVDYARVLSDTAIQLIAIPVGWASLVHFSTRTTNEIREISTRVITLMVGLTVPIAAWILLNSDFIVSVIFQRGAFNEQSVAITADVLSSMAPGLAAQCASYFLIKSLNAQDANRAVIGITLAGGAANIAFNLFAYKSLGIVTIGIGYTLQSWTTFILALHSIGLLRKSAGLLSLMGAGVVSYIFLTILFAPTEISRAITSTGFALLFWPIFFLFVPGIRDEIKAIATRISTKLNE